MSSIIIAIGLLIIALIALYFVIIRPQRRKSREKKELQYELKRGDIVTTIGGIVGTVCYIKENDDVIVLEIGADRVRIEVTRWALSSKGVQTGPAPARKKKEKKKEQIAEGS